MSPPLSVGLFSQQEGSNSNEVLKTFFVPLTQLQSSLELSATAATQLVTVTDFARRDSQPKTLSLQRLLGCCPCFICASCSVSASVSLSLSLCLDGNHSCGRVNVTATRALTHANENSVSWLAALIVAGVTVLRSLYPCLHPLSSETLASRKPRPTSAALPVHGKPACIRLIPLSLSFSP